jgi:ferrochelatase
VVCPGFVSDCLETLEEISIEGRHSFQAAGGGDFRYIPCLNDDPGFIRALAGLVSQHTGGWPVQRLDKELESAMQQMLEQRGKRAVERGAVQ